jgi:hypothetical protein
LSCCAAAALADEPIESMDACPLPDASVPERWEGEHLWQVLEQDGYKIKDIKITVDGVFDLSDRKENTWYGRTANALHINTHDHVIRDELLIRRGQTVDARRIYESERRLRALPYLRFADIKPAGCIGHSVVVEAHVKDAWSLKFDLNFAHVGGQSSLGASFEDVDFLGTGKTLAVGHQSDVQRSRNQVSYKDPAVWGSRWTFATTYAHLSDGFTRALDLSQPFYEDQAPWSATLHYLDQQQNLNFYENSQVAWRAPDITQDFELGSMWLLGWDGENGYGTRAGVSYINQDIRYGALQQFPPNALARPTLTPRRYVGFAGDFEYFEDHFASFTDLALIGRTEDYNLGWDHKARLGYFSEQLGSRVPAWFYDLTASYGGTPSDMSLLLASGELRGRHQQGREQGGFAQLAFTLYNQSLPRQTLVLHGEAGFGLRADPEDLQYLGGVQGMPGYPNYYLIGDRRWQGHVADRYFSDAYLLNIFRVGFEVYGDFGQIRRPGGAGWSRTLIDGGIALRLGDVRSAYGGVIYVTYAWPLVKLPGATERQFVIGNLIDF